MPGVTRRARAGPPLATVEVDVLDAGGTVVVARLEPGGGWNATRGPGGSLIVPWRIATPTTVASTNTKMPVMTTVLLLTGDNCSPGVRRAARASTGVSRAGASRVDRKSVV